MKILKGLLILAILLVICLSGISQTVLRNTDIQDGDIVEQTGSTTLESFLPGDYYYNPGKTYMIDINELEKPTTLKEWFNRLTLDEKVEIYTWWEKDNLSYFDTDGKLILSWD